MILIDANLLVYAHVTTFSQHPNAREWLDDRRLRDLADVQDLITALKLPLELADSLDPSAHPEYRRIWLAANPKG